MGADGANDNKSAAPGKSIIHHRSGTVDGRRCDAARTKAPEEGMSEDEECASAIERMKIYRPGQRVSWRDLRPIMHRAARQIVDGEAELKELRRQQDWT
jgi:hypothetical protein